MGVRLPILGSPIKIAGLELPNRMMTTSMSPGRGYISENNRPTQRMASYLAERAAGGTGLIVQTVVPWERNELEARNPMIHPLASCYDDCCIPDLKKYEVDPVHENGGLICAQIYCVHDWKPSPTEPESPWGPSDIAILKFMGGFKAMTLEHIEEFKRMYFNGVRVCRDAGFDAIEVMAGVGGIMSRFMARATNNRTDQYGGSVENRCRLTCEIIRGTRQVVGPDMPIIVRWSPVDFIVGPDGTPGLSMEESLEIAVMLEEAGADLHDLAVGWHETSEPLTTKDIQDLHWSWISEKIKTVATKPVAQGYRNTDPVKMEEALAAGKLDVIAGLRYSIADPAFPRKVMEDRLEEIRQCIVCCRCLDDVVSQGKPLEYCGVNPRLGRELDHEETPKTDRPKRIMVVGAGPAGINAAVCAAMRGHKVDLYEQGPRLCGCVKMSSIFSPYHERYLRYMRNLIKLHPEINIHLNTKVDAGMVESAHPDACILAVGGEAKSLHVPGERGRNVVTSHMFLEMLSGKRPRAKGMFNAFMWWGATLALKAYYTPSFARKATGLLPWPIGRNVAIIGGGLPGCEFGLLCMETGRLTSIVDDHKKIGFDVGGSDRFHMTKALKSADNVSLYPKTRVEEIVESGVHCVQTDEKGNEKNLFIPARTVAVTLGFERNDALYEAVRERCDEVRIIGDADDPCRIADATKAGYRAACAL